MPAEVLVVLEMERFVLAGSILSSSCAEDLVIQLAFFVGLAISAH